MFTRQQNRSQNRIFFLLSVFVALCVGLFLHCFDENPTGGDNLPTDLEIKVAHISGDNQDNRTFFVGESISVCIQVLEVEPIDSIVFGIIKNPAVESTEESIKAAVNTVLHRGKITSKNNLTIFLDQPGTFLLCAYARSKDTIAIDTVYVIVIEEDGNNQPPVVHVKPFRPYAAPSLPCSLRVSFSNQECWQIVKLLGDSMEQNITCIGDSICTWVPSGSDISKTYLLRIVAIDNGKPPKIGDTTIIVAVIPDNRQPGVPQDLRIAERSTEMVKLVWKMDSLVDGYTVLRSRTGAITIWDTIGKTKLPEYVDTTDTVFMYRVIANNYFGTTASGTDIVARDTVHYAHAIGFERGQSPSVSENDSVCVIKLQVSQAAKVPISVWLSAKGNSADSADTDDYKLQTPQVVFEKGTTFADVRLQITNDEKIEPPESLTVTIDSVSSGYLAGILQHKVVIADNDTLYKVSYDKNGADSGTVPMDSGSYKRGAKVTVKGNTGMLKRTGYSFSGWNTSSDGKGDAYTAGALLTMPSGTVILYAQWKADTVTEKDTLLYTVTYDGNGATAGAVPKDSIKYKTGAEVTVSDNTGGLLKEGHIFAGWNTNAGGTGEPYAAGTPLIMPSGNTILYARWKADTVTEKDTLLYTVTYDGNGATAGAVPKDSIKYKAGAEVTVSGNSTLVKTGYYFTNWNTMANGTGTPYLADDKFVMPAAAVSLYAQWGIGTYTVTYKGNGATGGTDPLPINQLFGTVIAVAQKGTLVRTGHSFNSWNTKADGSGLDYLEGGSFTIGGKNDTLYGRWNPNSYRVTFDKNDAGATGSMPVQPIVFGTSANLSVNGYAKTEHSFAGWATSSGGDAVYGNGASFTMATEGVTLFAKWTINRYKVTFNSQGGSAVDSQIVNCNDTAKTPGTPSRNGYTFGGWCRENDTTNLWTFITDKVTGDITLYAMWTINRYKVTFNSQGGSAVDSQMVNYNDTARTPAASSRSGYTFGGWYREAACTNQWNFSTDKMTANVAVYAKWTPITYTITYHLNGGTNGSNPANYTLQTATIALANATKTSYVFDGWYSDAGLTSLVTVIPSGSTGNKELWAKWVIKDVDGNIYTEVTIGSQVWLVENLKTTKYRDGTSIPNVTDSAAWSNLSTPGYCWYNNTSSYKETYGALYNWFTVGTGNLAPAGWHVPTDAELGTLEAYLGGSVVAGGKLKEAGTTHWSSPNEEATNESGFSALPGGCRSHSSAFFDVGFIGYWWSATEYGTYIAGFRFLYYTNAYLNRSTDNERLGLSVRCVRD